MRTPTLTPALSPTLHHAVVQKLLEMALDKFEAEQKAGSGSVFFFYQHGMCLVELASIVDVEEFAQRAVEMFGTAFAFRADPAAQVG